MYRFLFLIAVVVLSVWVVIKPLWDKTEIDNSKEVVTEVVIGETITSREINAFLDVWPKYVNSWVSRIGVPKLSMTRSNNFKKRLSFITIAWLNRHGWEAERFFYVEQRLRSIVMSLQTEEHSQKTIELLERQLASESNSSIRDNIAVLIEYQKRTVNIEMVSSKEMSLVKPYLSDVADVLDLDYYINQEK